MANGSFIADHPVVAHEEWIRARRAFLAKEKDFTRLRDELSRERRELPWEVCEKSYLFDGPDGQKPRIPPGGQSKPVLRELRRQHLWVFGILSPQLRAFITNF